jgi:hypothetical protein
MHGAADDRVKLMAESVAGLQRHEHYFADPFRWAGFGYFGA